MAPDQQTADETFRNSPAYYPFTAEILNNPKEAAKWNFQVEEVAFCGSFKPHSRP